MRIKENNMLYAMTFTASFLCIAGLICLVRHLMDGENNDDMSMDDYT
jgi:hypothetical protein